MQLAHGLSSEIPMVLGAISPYIWFIDGALQHHCWSDDGSPSLLGFAGATLVDHGSSDPTSPRREASLLYLGRVF
jgi:hypothetical protein